MDFNSYHPVNVKAPCCVCVRAWEGLHGNLNGWVFPGKEMHILMAS